MSGGAPGTPPRERILAAATALLVDGGLTAVSTRSVCAAADVQAPTLYRLFGDKQGLLDAVALDGFQTYLDDPDVLRVGPDPVDDLRRGWDTHVRFGLANPYLYSLAYGDVRPGAATPAAAATDVALGTLVHRIARAGRLSVAEPRAVQIMRAAGCGATLTLIAMPEAHRDPVLSTTMREVAVATITTSTGAAPPAPPHSAVGAAVQLRATLDTSDALNPPERELLRDWLDRIAGPSRGDAD